MAAVASARKAVRLTATSQRIREVRGRAVGGVRVMTASQRIEVLQARMAISIRRRYEGVPSMGCMRVLVVEDEPLLAEAIRDGLRLEAIAADTAGDGDTALELLGVNSYDIAVLDRDIPGPSGDEIASQIVASGSGMPILMLTAADRIEDKTSGFELGADDYLTKPFELRELVL